jgi:hypothetical protein
MFRVHLCSRNHCYKLWIMCKHEIQEIFGTYYLTSAFQNHSYKLLIMHKYELQDILRTYSHLKYLSTLDSKPQRKKLKGKFVKHC